MEVKNKRQIKKLMDDFNIDSGEAEALILGIQEDTGVVPTDDRNVIKTCKMLKLYFITAIAGNNHISQRIIYNYGKKGLAKRRNRLFQFSGLMDNLKLYRKEDMLCQRL